MLTMKWWKNLSVSKKLYSVVGLMATLILFELCTLAFVMSVLSSVRAFVGGEGLWSKAQKNAVFEMQNYVATGNPKYYKQYLDLLGVPLGDRQARNEMEKPNMDLGKVTEGFIKGRVHPQDIPSMVHLIRRFYDVTYLATAIDVWRKADAMLDQLIHVGDQLHMQISRYHKRFNSPEVLKLMADLTDINQKLTVLEDEFSYSLGAASRWVENTLLAALLIIVFIVESTGLFFTIRFTGGLSRILGELNSAATEVGNGNFSKVVPVHSGDELGQLASSLNKMTENLRVSKGEQKHAEAATQIKSLFLANMSHEIRTPLGAMLGFVELLKDPEIVPEERAHYLDIVERTGKSLATIINDILDISKVEAGKLEVQKAACNLTQLLQDLRLLLQLRCDEKGIFLKFAPVDHVPEVIYTDAIRLRQILLNIVGNAIKFTDRGGVTLSYRAGLNYLEFSVTDSGPGISEKDVPKLFSPFSQVDLSIRKAHGGAGLGLTLSRELAILLGGDVFLEKSEVGAGSTFGVRIALDYTQAPFSNIAQAARKTQPALSPARLDHRKILVVDDSAENQLLIQQFLMRSGAEVDIAVNGLEGMNKAQADKYDLVLMDMQMPIMDGYTATEELRKSGYLGAIIGLTAHAMREDLARCLQAGCNDVLTKPVARGQLIDFIAGYCEA